ncbi:MAG: hypothetical protein VX992_04465, partial [Acidobacteriota bacterium]|nr:hypothetical protein [Acidobacteriota bacterium]
MPSVIFRRGLNLKQAVAPALADDYDSAIVNEMISHGFQRSRGRLTVCLAKEFGFCYGVDRAVDYAYQTRMRFPKRQKGADEAAGEEAEHEDQGEEEGEGEGEEA